MKLLVVGFDGISPGCLKQVYKDSSFLMAGGAIKTLEAKIAISGPAWTTIYTGLPACEHKVFTPLGQPSEGSYSYADLGGKVVWDILGEAGYCVGLCGLPAASPVRKVNGFHAGGVPATPEEFLYPDTLDVPVGWLRMVDLSHYGTWTGKGWGGWAPALLQAAREEPGNIFKRVRDHSVAVASWFVEQCEHWVPDFGFVVFTFPDRLGHLYGQTGACYNAICATINHVMWVLEAIRPESLLIVSDHGFATNGAKGTADGHTKMGVIAAFGQIARLLDERQDWVGWDVMPLILEYFQLPQLTRIFGGYEDEEAELVVETRLKDLGYLG